MKKLFLTILSGLFAISLNAQEQHFKFMGIPLDGKISAFHKEMLNKGFTLDENFGKSIDGAYLYNGIFAGETSQVLVNYDEKTRIVYQACTMITRYTKDQALSLYQDMYDMLEKKYSQDPGVRFYLDKMNEIGADPFKWIFTEEKDGYDFTDFAIPDVITRDLKGVISLFIRESYSQISYRDEFNLYIRYTDGKNRDLHEDNKMDDL